MAELYSLERALLGKAGGSSAKSVEAVVAAAATAVATATTSTATTASGTIAAVVNYNARCCGYVLFREKDVRLSEKKKPAVGDNFVARQIEVLEIHLSDRLQALVVDPGAKLKVPGS